VIAAHEAAEDGNAGLRRRRRGMVDGGCFAENPGFPHREVSILFMFTSILNEARGAWPKGHAGYRNGRAVVPRVDVDPVQCKIKFFFAIDSIR